MKDKLAEEYLRTALGNNMNISTLKLKFWTEVMTDFAREFHEAKMKEITDADIEAWVSKAIDRLLPLRHRMSKRTFETISVALEIGAKAMQNGEIKHIEK